MRIHATAFLALLSTTILSAPALAQVEPAATSPAQGSQTADVTTAETSEYDIVVTARRRREFVQDTPLAITAIGAARLEEAHVTNISDLTNLAPSINLARNTTNPTSLFPFIRGFGTKSTDPATEPPVVVTIDGIYMGALVGAFINISDVEAVEVLRGPQGTLLGKNAPAGGVSIRTRRPGREFGGGAEVEYGRWDQFRITGFVDVPLIKDRLYSTISVVRERSDGFVKNLTTGKNAGGVAIDSIRVGLLADLGDFNWYVQGTYTHDGSEFGANRNISDFSPLVIPTAVYCPYEQPLAADGFPGQTRCRINPATGTPFPGSAPPVTTTCINPYSRILCTSGASPNNRRYTTQANLIERLDSWNAFIASNMEFDTGPVTIAAVTGWREFRELAGSDNDGTALAISDSPLYDGRYQQWSHEFRVASSPGGGLDMDGRLNWLIGAYYFNFDYARDQVSVNLGRESSRYQDGTTNSYALFAHAELEVIDGLTLSGGIRQSWDRKTHTSCTDRCKLGFLVPSPIPGQPPTLQFDPTFAQRENWDNLSYDVTLQYDITPDNMVFVRYATGYRGGGFVGLPATAAQVASYDPETVEAWEIGTRNDFFDHRLRINVNVFRSDYSDLIRNITIQIPDPPFFLQRPRNIAGARTQGVEVEALARPIEGLVLRANVGYLDAKYTNFVANLTGNPANPTTDNSDLKIPYTSKWSIQLGGSYEVGLGEVGSLTFAADWAYRSRQNLTDLEFAQFEQKGYGVLNASVTWRDAADRFSASVFVRNLTNQFYIDGGDAIGNLTSYLADGQPRSWGVSAGFRF